MRCDRVEEISALIDGELSPDGVRNLSAHILNCQECQNVRADFLNQHNEITAFNPAVDPLGSQQRLARILGPEYPKPASSRLGVPALLRSPGRPWAFATIAFLMVASVVGFLVYRVVYRPTTPQAQDSYVAIDKNKSLRNANTGIANPDQRGNSNRGEADKRGIKKPKPKQGRRVEPPKPRFAPPELTSPYGSQAIATNNDRQDEDNRIAPADTQTLTAKHLEQSEVLLRSFRNVRSADTGRPEIAYERQRAQKLVYQNILLRREADASGDVQVTSLLDSLEPILLDIANLPDRPHEDDVRLIKERMQRKNLVALLQVNSIAIARAND